MSRPILDLEVCDTYFFSASGISAMKHPKAWAPDNTGKKWTEYEGKRCKVVDDYPPFTHRIPYAKTGRS